MQAIFNQAYDAFQAYKNTPVYFKSDVLRKISETITAEKESLSKLIVEECKKPVRYALSEVDRTAQTFLIASEEAKRLPAEYISGDWTPATRGKELLVKHFPIGVVLGFTPFNFPMNLVAHKVAPALAAGCSIVIKPSPRTVKSAHRLAELALKCGLPEGVFQVIDVPNNEAAGLVDSEYVKMLSFTGSPAVGWQLKSKAGKKKVALELGGNAAVIITPTADYKNALKKCLTGGFAYSGQVCIHTQRIYVQDALFDKFLADYSHEAAKLKRGNPSDVNTELAELIDEAAAIRVESWVKQAIAEGAVLKTGGHRDGAFYEPTVLTHTSNKMAVSCDEIFGPVVIVERYQDLQEAIRLVNESPFGLQAGIFTDSQAAINTAFHQIEVGGLIVNDVPTSRADHMPYGGVKDSGFGREGVKYAIQEMMEPRVLMKNT